MEQPILFEPLKNAKRIKIYIPYEFHSLRKTFKRINSTYWHPNQKLWSFINTKQNMALVKELFRDNLIIKQEKAPIRVKTVALNNKAMDVLYELEKMLVLRHYGQSSIRVYKNMLKVFLSKFMHYNLKDITKEQIEQFVFDLIKRNNISESYQNQLINAINGKTGDTDHLIPV